MLIHVTRFNPVQEHVHRQVLGQLQRLKHTSIAILDALLALEKPIIEVHMSNINRREPFRHHSFISKAATGIVAGLGPLGYELAITAIAQVLERANRA